MLFGNNATVGVDLGSTGFRAVELSWVNGQPTIARWAAADFPKEVTDWRTTDCAATAGILRTTLASRGLRAHWASHSISGENVAPQYFNFPQLMPEDIAEAVRIEVEAATPFKGDSALMTYLLFPERRLGQNKVRTHGLAIAAERNYVESRLTVMRGANLEPFAVETDSTACANAFLSSHRYPTDGTVALINIGHRYSNLSLIGGEGTLLVRDVPWGGFNLTQAIAERLSVPPDEAEQTKRRHWAEASEMAGLLHGAALEFVARLRDTIEYWASEQLVPQLKHVYITGGGSQVHGLPEFIAEEVGAPVERWSPVTSVPGDSAGEWKSWSYRLSAAFGLALRKFERKPE